MRIFSFCALATFSLLACGCEGDYQGQPNQKAVEIKQSPDLDPRTDHDIDIKTPDVDVDVNRGPGRTSVEVDAFKTPDVDTKADQP